MPTPTYPNLPGGSPLPGYGAYGGVPGVPDPLATAGGAISGNIGNLAALYGLTTGTSAASAAGARTQYEANLPGYTDMTTQASGDILSHLQGRVPQDVINLLGQQAAERGVGFGAGAPNSNAALLRALGLTSMGLQAQGQSELTGAIGRTPVGPAFNPASFLVSPSDVQGAAYGANVAGAAPDPQQAAEAAIRAQLAGLGAGRASVPQAPGIATPGPLGGGGSAPASPATGTMIGGVPYYGGSTPATAGQNWNDWYQSIIGGGGGGAGSFEDQMYGPGSNSEEDIFGGLGWDYGAGATNSGTGGGTYDMLGEGLISDAGAVPSGYSDLMGGDMSG